MGVKGVSSTDAGLTPSSFLPPCMNCRGRDYIYFSKEKENLCQFLIDVNTV